MICQICGKDKKERLQKFYFGKKERILMCKECRTKERFRRSLRVKVNKYEKSKI